jgi:hypothetical protein
MHRRALRTGLSDDALLDVIQQQTLQYFWDFGHPISGMARESSKHSRHTVATGATGFGIMAIITGAHRGWLSHQAVRDRITKIVDFLDQAPKYHGAFSHWMHGDTGETIPFSKDDDGGDLVETSFLIQGLLTARQYFTAENDAKDADKDLALCQKINHLWKNVAWNKYVRDGALYWHTKPFLPVQGWNEALITYVLAASSPTHPITPAVYHQGWAQGGNRPFLNGNTYYGYQLPLGPDQGGPLFLSQYSFLGLDPRGLKDRYADYWSQVVSHTQINRQHCIDNPKGFKGYGEKCWGLTAGYNHRGYGVHSPADGEDIGVITLSAAFSAFPYTPEFSLQVMRHVFFDLELGTRMWGEYGFYDGFNETVGWYADSYLGINQGPPVVMIENGRSGLHWKLFMCCPEIQHGLHLLGFESPHVKQGESEGEPNIPQVSS